MQKFLSLLILPAIVLAGCSSPSTEDVDVSLNEESQVDSGSVEIPENFTEDDMPVLGKDYGHSLYTMSYPVEYSPEEVEKNFTRFVDENDLAWMTVYVQDEKVESYSRFTKVSDITFAGGEGTLWTGEGYCDGPAAANCAEPRIIYSLYDGNRTYEITIIGTAEENEMTKAVLNSFKLVQ